MKKNVAKVIKQNDIILSCGILLITIFLIIDSSDVNYPSNIMPLTLETLIVILTVIILIKSILKHDLEKTKQSQDSVNWLMAGVMFFGSIIYLIIMSLVGFYVTSFFFMALSSWILGKDFSINRLGLNFIVSGVTIFIIFFVFYFLLKVPMATGILL